jgi:hypothetical protein
MGHGCSGGKDKVPITFAAKSGLIDAEVRTTLSDLYAECQTPVLLRTTP